MTFNLKGKVISQSLGSLVNGDVLNMIRLPELKGKLEIVQICPQNSNIVTKSLIDNIIKILPNSEIRLHANVKIMDKEEKDKYLQMPTFMADLSSYHRKELELYWKRLHYTLSYIGNTYSIHAGKRNRCSLKRLVKNLKSLEQDAGVCVAVEGMYPTNLSLRDNKKGYLMDTLEEYRYIMESNSSYVIDLSHMNIIKNQTSKTFDVTLVKELLEHNNCKEIHISGNNGSADTHDVLLDNNIWWYDLLNSNKNVSAKIISEERM